VSDREIGSTLGHRWPSFVALLLLGLAPPCTVSCDGGTVASTTVCNPLSFGAVGDGNTDNTTAIQNAVNACAAQGGGIVELSVDGKNAVYVTGPFTLKSHVHLQIDQGVTLQATNAHSRYVAAYINWVYQPNEALISAKGATTSQSSVPALSMAPATSRIQMTAAELGMKCRRRKPPANPSRRPWVLEFYQCDHITISGVTLQNQPYWTQALRFSSDIPSPA